MKYLFVALLLSAIAGLQVFHALAHEDVSEVAACMAPEGKAAVVRDALLSHLRSH